LDRLDWSTQSARAPSQIEPAHAGSLRLPAKTRGILRRSKRMQSPRQNELQGKVVLVTGAAKRIGRGIALRLGAEGARVAIHYHRSEADARRTAEECGGAELFRANLESVEEIGRMFAEVDGRLGRLDGLVNNAARFTRFDPLDITEKDWDFIHSV